jgi:hypothetical protein
VLGEDVLEPVTGERAAAGVEKELGAACQAAQREPSAERRRRRLPEWQEPLAPPFAPHVNGGLRLKGDLIKAQTDELGDPQPGGKGEVQHGAVAHAIASMRVRGVKHCLHLVARQVSHQPLVGLLGGDRQQAADLLEAGGHPVLDEAREGLDGGESRVAGARRVAPRGLEVIEEGEHEGHIEVLERQGRGLGAQPLGREDEEQLEGVGIGIAGMRAGLSLAGKTVS